MQSLTFTQKLLLLGSAFLVLLGLRLAYGYWSTPNGQIRTAPEQTYIDTGGFELERKNYASSKIKSVPNVNAPTQLAAVDQKYEKIGTLTSASAAYDTDEKALYDLVAREQLMIQLEQRAGLTPARQLNLALGVIPAKFDQTIEALRKIGDLKSIQIDKNDKTNEYKRLEAQRVSLLKGRDTLLELRQSGGSTGEMIQLTNQLLDIENQIQTLGVSLGEFDEQNEFCTVKFSLKEIPKPKAVYISFLQRLKVAFVWTAQVYFMFWLTIALALLGLWLLASLLSKLQALNNKAQRV